MKINITQHNNAIRQGDFTLHSGKEKLGVKNRGYNAGYCGSFTGKSEAAVTVSKPFIDKLLSSGWFGSLLSYAEKHNISTSALIALVLAGVLRPATIMALPGKKDKEDKIYASGHAMASGIMGFIISTILTSPLDESITKLFNEEKNGKFLRGQFKEMQERVKELKILEENGALTKETKQELKSLVRKINARNTIVKNLPDWIIGVPRAMLTIALIPPILKYVFGLEKKKKPVAAATDSIPQTNMNFVDKSKFMATDKPESSNPKELSFKGNPINNLERAVQKTTMEESSFFKPIDDLYSKMTDFIADKFTSRFVNSKPITYLADKFQNSSNLFQHCLTVGSVITSGLYMQRTLANKDLDKDRKKTLAMNQGLTLGVSTAGAYMLDKYMKNWWENVTSRFVGLKIEDKNFNKDFKDIKKVINIINKELKKTPNADMMQLAEKAKKDLQMTERGTQYLNQFVKKAVDEKGKPKIELKKFIKTLVKDEKMVALSEKVSKQMKGMGLLRTMIVFGFVYRYFVPVVVTKPANWLCERIFEGKKQKNAA